MQATVHATITKLVIYPVKSLQGIEVQQAICLETGLQYDREWVIVNDNNQFMSQRNIPAMATIQVNITDTHLVLSHPEHGECTVSLANNQADAEEVTIWKDQSLAKDEGQEVSTWLTTALGEFRGSPLRLVRFDASRQRIVREKYTQTTDSTLMFADACPYLVVSNESLTALNEALTQNNHLPVSLDRFRGNIEVSDIAPWQEYHAKTIQINQVILRGEAPCHRCPMPGIDQKTGSTPEPGQPFKTLMQMTVPEDRSGAYFGLHATFDKQATSNVSENTIKTGDTIHFAS